jgi:hypothetical protein
MHHRIEIVHTDPGSGTLSFDMQGRKLNFSAQPAPDIICYGTHLCGGVAFTNDEKICGGIMKPAKIQLKDMLTFDVLYAVNNQIIDLFLTYSNCFGLNY